VNPARISVIAFVIPALVAVLFAASAASAQSLTLSPAVVPLGGKPGQSTHQHLTLFNGTRVPLAFAVRAKDVVVRGGKRQFIQAGDLAGSVAATAVFSAATVSLQPGEERSIDLTLTLPAAISQRAVVIIFEGTTRVSGTTTVSIGSLLTFDLAGTVSVAPGVLAATPPTASTNAAVSLPIANDGTEPTIVRAAAVIIGATGALRGKLALEPRRLLPGEAAEMRAELAGDLPPGTYRVVATVETGKRSWARTTELVVP
jgi:hypothetical protein